MLLSTVVLRIQYLYAESKVQACGGQQFSIGPPESRVLSLAHAPQEVSIAVICTGTKVLFAVVSVVPVSSISR